MGLETYHRKRDFEKTPEPEGRASRRERRRFVVQEHHASRLHFDFRLEMGGVLKSWSVPKGPTLDPHVKRLAVMTEDHPVEYLKFEGRIPEGQYGAGEQLIWDAGDYRPRGDEDPLRQLKEGKLSFELRGDKLRGEFNLIRMKGREDQWLLIKSDDEFAQPGWTLALRTGERIEETSGARKKKREGRAHQPPSKIRVKAKRESRPVAASRAFKAKELSGGLDLKVGKDIVALTSLDKVYWPEDGYTKGDLVRYYYEEVIGRAGLECFAKTSGSRGIHVYAPLKPVHSYKQVADFAERVASIVASKRPDLATVERSLKKRPRRSVYVDHFQNARGKSVVAPYSARPRPGATVSAPLDWAEVRRGKISPQDFTIENMRKRIERKGDLFKPALKLRQRLGAP